MRLGAGPLHFALLGKIIDLRQRNGRNVERTAFHSPGDGAGIGDVVGRVHAAIDAGEQQRGLGVLHQMGRRHHHAIGRRAGDGEMAVVDLAQAQRRGERQRMRGAGLLGVGGDHPDIVGQRPGDGFGDGQSLRMDAVVVGEQDTQCTHFFSIFVMPMYDCKASGMRMEPSLS